MRNLFQTLLWPWHNWMLGRVTEPTQFTRYVSQTRARKFLNYQAASRNKRAEFLSVLSALQVDPRGLRFLDLGPGYGDSLDLCHELGAKSVTYTEIDPFFFTHNRLKKFTTGHRLNHLTKLHQLPIRSFDLIWCKGSIVADLALLSERLPILTWRFTDWLDQLEKLAAPGAHIVICPHWRNDGKTRRVPEVRGSLISEMMLTRGFDILPAILGHNHEPEYPATYYKKFTLAVTEDDHEENAAPLFLLQDTELSALGKPSKL